jgi:hypothetical protein
MTFSVCGSAQTGDSHNAHSVIGNVAKWICRTRIISIQVSVLKLTVKEVLSCKRSFPRTHPEKRGAHPRADFQDAREEELCH